MFLSIIIPVYKVEPYLRECLDSIAESPLVCWEAILIDDGSPDDCPQICDEYVAKDKRFHVIHQQNAGVAAARNAGLDMAHGEWCWFVDSDDVVDMRPVESIIEWLKASENETAKLYKNKGKMVNVPVSVDVNTSVDLVMFDLKAFNDGDPIPLKTGAPAPMVSDDMMDKNEFLLRHVCYHHPRLWYRCGWVNHHHQPLRFTQGMKTAEDGEFQYKYLMLCQHPVRVHNTIYYYRQREGSASNSPNTRAQVVKDTIQAFGNLLQYMVENKVRLEPWLVMRLQGSMKILLYSIHKSKQQYKSEMQQAVRTVFKQYKDAGYDTFKSVLLKIAYFSIPLYSLLLRINLRIKGLQ